jgi:predicted MFS family arabinose efflux permease
MNTGAWLGQTLTRLRGVDNPDTARALRVATAAYVLGVIAQATWLFYFAPVNLRAAGVEGADAWAFAASAAATMVTVVPAGMLADRFPRRWVMRVGLALLALSYTPLLAPPGVGPTVLASTISGTGLAFLAIPFNSYVADLLSGASMAKGYGAAGALSVLASAAGPLAAAQLFRLAPDELTGLRWNAALFALVALAGVVLSLGLPHVASPLSRARLARSPKILDRAVLPVAVFYVFAGISFGATTPYFAVHFLRNLGTPTDQWGVALACATAAGALGFWLAGRLAASFPGEPLLVAGQILTAACCVAFVLPIPTLALLAAFVLRYVFGNTIAPLANTMMMGKVDPGGRGFAQGFASMAWNLGWSVGALAGGPLLARWGGALFPIGATLGILGALAGIAVARAMPQG